MDRDAAAARVLARLMMLAVVVGLFVMHGLPAQACAGGGGMSPSDPVATSGEQMPAQMSAQSSVADAVASPHPTRPDRPLTAARSAMPGHGAACVFTAPARNPAAALLALLVLAAVALLVTPTPSRTGRLRRPFQHRGPPRGGAELLTTLCVSRT